MSVETTSTAINSDTRAFRFMDTPLDWTDSLVALVIRVLGCTEGQRQVGQGQSLTGYLQ